MSDHSMARPEPRWPAPAGHVHEAVPAGSAWSARPRSTTARCRYPGEDRKACGAPAVASLNRGTPGKPRWWDYCGDPEHMYGRWIEDGRVMEWRVVPVLLEVANP